MTGDSEPDPAAADATSSPGGEEGEGAARSSHTAEWVPVPLRREPGENGEGPPQEREPDGAVEEEEEAPPEDEPRPSGGRTDEWIAVASGEVTAKPTTPTEWQPEAEPEAQPEPAAGAEPDAGAGAAAAGLRREAELRLALERRVDGLDRRLDGLDRLSQRLDEAGQRIAVLPALQSGLRELGHDLADRAEAQRRIGEHQEAFEDAVEERLVGLESRLAELERSLLEAIAAEARSRSSDLEALTRQLDKALETARERAEGEAANRKLLSDRQRKLAERLEALADDLGGGAEVEQAAREHAVEQLRTELGEAIAAEREGRQALAAELEGRVAPLAAELQRLGTIAAELEDGLAPALEEAGAHIAEVVQLKGTLEESMARIDETLNQGREQVSREREEREWLEQRLDGRLVKLERSLDELSRAAERGPIAAAPAPTPIPGPAPARAPAPSPFEPAPGEASELEGADLNALNFEQLRLLGLSTTQAARVLAARERIGGFSSLQQLDAVPGLPGELRQELKRRITVTG